MQKKICSQCSVGFEITDDDVTFYESISPIFEGQKNIIPSPTLCPDCRQQRRLGICNERYLYPGECGLCKKRLLTEYSPHRKQPIYCRECWHSDKWDPRDYGQEFDFARSFFEQIQELQRKTPALALSVQGTCVNSDYIHYAGDCKNCYLIMHADFCEDCYYGYGFKKNILCVDGFYNLHCELCYDCVDVHKSYDLKGCQDCISSSSSAFLRDCIGCKNCFCCVGLRNKEYCFENQQFTKEEYQKRLKAIDTASYQQYQYWKHRRKELEKIHAFKEFQGSNLEDCLGNYLYNCKNAQYCFDCEDVEDAKFCYQIVLGGKNVYDLYQFGTNVQESYESAIIGGNSYHILFTFNCDKQDLDLLYCWYMERSKNCFGCANIHSKSYCVLNKQYSKEEYEKLVPKIIEHMRRTGEWGEFFPLTISPHGYNKSSAQMYYPLKKEEALAQGLVWDDYEPSQPVVAQKIPAQNLPDNINDVSDDILNAAVECEVTHKFFKIIPQELRFYRQQKIPLPRRHPDQRHLDRFFRRNPRKFWQRECAKCKKNILTTYYRERPEVVYCESCYMQTIY